MKKIIILGTGGNCFDILDTINKINGREQPAYECVGFLDDNTESHGKSFHGVKVLGGLTDATSFLDCVFGNGIGSPESFWKKSAILGKLGVPTDHFETIIHPTVDVSAFAEIGGGSVILANATLCANVRIGRHVIVLPGSVINHDCTIGDYACIAAGVSLSGNVTVEDSCYLGSMCSIIGGVTVHRRSLIGMGSVVLKDIPEGQVFAGNPARFIRKIKIN